MKYCVSILLASLALGSAMKQKPHGSIKKNRPWVLENKALVQDVKQNFLEGLQKKLGNVSQEDIDQLKSMTTDFEPVKDDQTGMTCNAVTFTGSNDCVVSTRGPKLVDIFKGMFTNLKEVNRPADVPAALVKAMVNNPCSCLPIKITEGCSSVIKTVLGLHQMYCEA